MSQFTNATIGQGFKLLDSRHTYLQVTASQTIAEGSPAALDNWERLWSGIPSSSTQFGVQEVQLYKFRVLKAFLANPLSSYAYGRIVDADLLTEVVQVVLAISRFFPTRRIFLRTNDQLESPHKLELWVQGKEDIDAELDILDQFDNEWLATQTSKLRHDILVFLE